MNNSVSNKLVLQLNSCIYSMIEGYNHSTPENEQIYSFRTNTTHPEPNCPLLLLRLSVPIYSIHFSASFFGRRFQIFNACVDKYYESKMHFQ